MSQLLDFVLPALLVSTVALTCLRWMGPVPPGVRIGMALLGLSSWVVPWHLFDWSLASTGATAVGSLAESGAELALLKERIATTIQVMAPAPGFPSAMIGLVFLPGLVWLVADAGIYLATLRRWERSSASGDHLADLLPPELRRARIRVVPHSSQAVAAGILRPSIYVGERWVGLPELPVVLTHEANHVRRRDPVWLVLVWSIARLYWFNPIVAALEREARLAVENACDEDCARQLGRHEYRRSLADLVLRRAERRLALAPGLSSPKLDLRRLGLLAANPQMGSRAWLGVVAAILACPFGAGVAAVALDPGVGDWIEISDLTGNGYNLAPAWRQVERLPNGMTRLSRSGPSGAPLQIDFRCDGRSYLATGQSDQVSISKSAGSTLSCSVADSRTRSFVLASPDGTFERWSETISRDGEALYQSSPKFADGARTGAPRTFVRVP